jgi:RNA recognition motif-containing protein
VNYGFVEFVEIPSAERAILEMNGSKLLDYVS